MIPLDTAEDCIGALKTLYDDPRNYHTEINVDVLIYFINVVSRLTHLINIHVVVEDPASMSKFWNDTINMIMEVKDKLVRTKVVLESDLTSINKHMFAINLKIGSLNVMS